MDGWPRVNAGLKQSLIVPDKVKATRFQVALGHKVCPVSVAVLGLTPPWLSLAKID
jgi:hypothetical protein